MMSALRNEDRVRSVQTSLDISTVCAVLFATATSGGNGFEVMPSCVLLPSDAGLLASPGAFL